MIAKGMQHTCNTLNSILKIKEVNFTHYYLLIQYYYDVVHSAFWVLFRPIGNFLDREEESRTNKTVITLVEAFPLLSVLLYSLLDCIPIPTRISIKQRYGGISVTTTIRKTHIDEASLIPKKRR